ncbi:hypothetical protein [Catelliglobosispora koreensis]|uniref:hypothetical protein n=1 Tax=Catelliglobosispora koreensis TaxID=129052 RepID=UPI000377CCD1|nr:hypothetical protein [Catelliglobosispora koreensis]
MEQLSLVVSHRYRGPKHRNGTPGLVPYRQRSGRPARHRRRTRVKMHQVTLALASITAGILLVLSGYRAAEGAAVILSMF